MENQEDLPRTHAKSKHARMLCVAMTTVLILSIVAYAPTVPLAHATAVEMSKTHSPSDLRFHPGDIVTFNISLSVYDKPTNLTAISIENLTLTDTLPAGEIYNAGSQTNKINNGASSGTAAFASTVFANGTTLLTWIFGPGPFTQMPQAEVGYTITVNGSFLGNQLNIATAIYDETESKAHSTPVTSDSIFTAVPALILTKTPSSPKVESAGEVTYTYNVTNIGDETLTVSVTDSAFGTIATGQSVAAGQSLILNHTATLFHNTTNTATATGVDQSGGTTSANATATVAVIHPAIGLQKIPSATIVANNTSVTYTYIVSNLGDTSLSGVSIDDDHFGTIAFGQSLAVGESLTFLKDTIITGNTTNTATADGVDQLGVHAIATATVTVTVGPPPPPPPPPPPGVGGTVVAVDNSLLIAPWVALLGLVGLISFVALRKFHRF